MSSTLRLLTQPSQLSAFEVGRIFVFNEGTPKVYTTFGVEERELAGRGQ
jgi:hypothetical protein